MADKLGLVITGTKPDYVEIITEKPLSIGTYVNILHQDGDCLGLIEDSSARSSAMNDEEMTDWETATETARFARKDSRDIGYRSNVKVIGDIESLVKGKTKIPSVPPNPSTEIHAAKPEVLQEIFAPSDKKWVDVGSLLRSDTVDVKIDLDQIVSRHLAILSKTGMGKSNFVAVIAREIAKKKGTMIIFDYHSDYDKMQLQDKDGNKISINQTELQIKPSVVGSDRFADLIDIPSNAHLQRQLLQELFVDVVDSNEFWDDLIRAIENVRDAQPEEPVVNQPENAPPVRARGGQNDNERERRDRVDRARRLLPRVERARRLYSRVIDSNALEPKQALKPHIVNVLDGSEFNEKQADIGLNHYLETIFEDRKEAVLSTKSKKDVIFDTPVLFVIEEAHAFIKHDKKGETGTDTKNTAGRIAAQARKFGLGLAIVSQRPAKVDEDILSQMGSFVVLKLIQKRDQDIVANTSEDITESLARQLSSLNNGEAFFTGGFVKTPTLTKIDDVGEMKGGRGSDISATDEWEKNDKMNIKVSSQDLIDKEDL